jgi:hypothetical protein
MMKYTYTIIICCLFAILAATGVAEAQSVIFRSVNDTTVTLSETDTTVRHVNELRHEIALYGAGGMSVLNYSPDMNGSKTDGLGAIGGIGYTWNINYRLGITTGLEVTSYNAKTTYDAISMDKNYGAGVDRFNFRYSMSNYVEEQDVTFIMIPAMLQYSVPLSGSAKFYVSGGCKVGLPIRANATIFPGTVNTSGHYYFENQTYISRPDVNMEQYGFVSGLKPDPIESDIDVTVLITASLETGARFYLTDNILLYTGAYVDYGLNSIRSEKSRNLINYQEHNPSELKYASVLNTPHVNNVKVLGAGLKVKISFGW